VGNEYVRGVSGGERKRVSIAETLATKSTVVCWDNSTRGLDASTALDYANSLRVMTDISNRTTFVTLYQAGEGIYQLMDKVLVIEEGRMIYQGPARDAKAYFQVRTISEMSHWDSKVVLAKSFEKAYAVDFVCNRRLRKTMRVVVRGDDKSGL
jgi:ABC-type multidrug transport system ATPase subunit